MPLIDQPRSPLVSRAPRQLAGTELDVSCRTDPAGADLALAVVNTSAEGIGLLVSEPLAKGTQVFLTSCQSGQSPVERCGMVQWSRRVYGQYTRIGVRLQAPTPPPAPPVIPPVAPDRATSAPQARGDRRNRGRQGAKGSARVSCWFGRTEVGPDIALTLIDVCTTGVRLLVNKRLSVGDEVSLVFQARGHTSAVRRRGTIRWSVRTDNWASCVGIELSDWLTEDELAILA